MSFDWGGTVVMSPKATILLFLELINSCNTKDRFLLGDGERSVVLFESTATNLNTYKLAFVYSDNRIIKSLFLYIS